MTKEQLEFAEREWNKRKKLAAEQGSFLLTTRDKRFFFQGFRTGSIWAVEKIAEAIKET